MNNEQSEDTNGGKPDNERYVCIPCREMVPERAGEVLVPGGTNGTVWCPWCGDEMEEYNEEHHGQLQGIYGNEVSGGGE